MPFNYRSSRQYVEDGVWVTGTDTSVYVDAPFGTVAFTTVAEADASLTEVVAHRDQAPAEERPYSDHEMSTYINRALDARLFLVGHDLVREWDARPLLPKRRRRTD